MICDFFFLWSNFKNIFKWLDEASQKLRQELFDNSNGQLINISRTLTQASDSLSKIQKSIEVWRNKYL